MNTLFSKITQTATLALTLVAMTTTIPSSSAALAPVQAAQQVVASGAVTGEMQTIEQSPRPKSMIQRLSEGLKKK